MLLAAERSKVVVLLLLFIVCRCSHCSGWGVSVGSLFWFSVLCVLSRFAIISLGKRELVAKCLLCSKCHVTVIDLGLFLVVPWVGL